MLFTKNSVLALIAAAQYTLPTLAHGIFPRQALTNTDNHTQTYPFFIPGDDVPSDPSTTGTFINHLSLNVHNATESIAWYHAAFGLRLLFTLRMTEHISLSYMGHANGGRNGTGYQTSSEMAREKNNREGLLEFLHVEAPSLHLPSGLETPNTLSHIGVVVPDVAAAQERLEKMGARILKRYKDTNFPDEAFADSTGLSGVPLGEIGVEERERLRGVLGKINELLLFVADPDGNVVEIQGQEEGGFQI